MPGVKNSIRQNAVEAEGILSENAGASGKGTLADETFTRYMSDGRQVTDVTNLPGSDGIRMPRRLTKDEMIYLTQEYGVEFAQAYHYGQGKNGGGGYYTLYSGTENQVNIAKSFAPDVMLINHTHPKGTAYPNAADQRLLQDLQRIGSPQRVSEIIPIGKERTVFFDINGVKK